MAARTVRHSGLPYDAAGQRSSHFESAQEANDIYNLYGRDSWAVSESVGLSPQLNGSHSQLHDMSYPLPNNRGDQEELEELDESQYSDDDDEAYATPRPFGDNAADYMSAGGRSPNPNSPLIDGNGEPVEWEFVPGYAGRPSADYIRPSTAQDFTRQDDEWSVGGHSEANVAVPGALGHGSVGEALTHDQLNPAEAARSPKAQPHQLAQAWTAPRESTQSILPGVSPSDNRSSRATSSRTPPVSQTPDLVVHESPDEAADETGRGSAAGVPARLRPEQVQTPPQGLSPVESSANSPVHPSITRITASPRNTLPGSGASSSAGMSTASLVSSRYPGEDSDAYHVRSTYARLDIEGVYGDGWDEGVERTRGGIGAGSRMTTSWPAENGVMTDQELSFLKSLDRYGFVDANTASRSEHRLVRVPAAPFKTHPKVQEGSSKAASSPKAGGGRPPSPPSVPPGGPSRADVTRSKKKEAERVGKWMAMMSVAERDDGRNAVGWRWSAEEGAKHTTRIWKGIPDRWRMAAWWTLSEATAERERRKGGRIPPADTMGQDYQVRRDLPSTNDVQIDLDVPRTISGHVLFRTRFGHGQRMLFHVLHAFSQACPTCGYCQGMGSVAATLLCYFEPERTYSLMVRLHDVYDMHGMFAPGFPGLLETFYVQERLMEAILPDVYESFKRNMISSSAWGAKIYITLFVNVVPFNVQLRLWDAMFLDGIDVMITAVTALLWAFRKELAHPAADFESILSLLSSYYVPEDEDAMLDWMRRLLWQPGVRELISGWRREWRKKVEEGTSGEALL